LLSSLFFPRLPHTAEEECQDKHSTASSRHCPRAAPPVHWVCSSSVSAVLRTPSTPVCSMVCAHLAFFFFFWGGEAGVAWLAGGAAAGDGQVVRPPTYPRPSSFFKIKKKKIVDGGHRAVKFSRVYGVTNDIYSEGTHFRIPWFETPIIYDVRAKPRNIASLTGSKGASCLFSYPIDLFFPPRRLADGQHYPPCALQAQDRPVAHHFPHPWQGAVFSFFLISLFVYSSFFF